MRACHRLILFSSSEQETFDHPAGIHSAPEKPRRKYSGVVGHEQIAGPQKVGQIAEAAVLGPGVETIQHHQARRAARRRRLRDELCWQIEVEFGNEHRGGC